jgi:hypothetical protein
MGANIDHTGKSIVQSLTVEMKKEWNERYIRKNQYNNNSKNGTLMMSDRQTKGTMMFTEGCLRLGRLNLLSIIVIVEFGCLKGLGFLSSLSNKRNNSSSECIITEWMVGDTIINW